MLQTPDQAGEYARAHQSVLGAGWKEVRGFDDLDDDDEYETDEEVEYVTLDLGAAVDPKLLQTAMTYQLIGMDTALPFLKVGNTLLQGDVTPLIGDEVILSLERTQENPHNPSHPPSFSTNKRITFRPISLVPDTDPVSDVHHTKANEATRKGSRSPSKVNGTEQEQVSGRSMFLQRDPTHGPNVGNVHLAQRSTSSVRGRKSASPVKKNSTSSKQVQDQRTELVEEAMEGEGEAGQGAAEGETGSPLKEISGEDREMERHSPEVNTKFSPSKLPQAVAGPSSIADAPEAGSSVAPRRTRTRRPEVTIRTAQELKEVDLEALPDNVKLYVYASAVRDTPSLRIPLEAASSASGDTSGVELPLLYTRAQLAKLLGQKVTTQRAKRRNKPATTSSIGARRKVKTPRPEENAIDAMSTHSGSDVVDEVVEGSPRKSQDGSDREDGLDMDVDMDGPQC